MTPVRLQIFLTPEAQTVVEGIVKEANENFSAGRINHSQVISEMVLNSKIDIKLLQLKHTDWRRSAKAMAVKEEMDLDTLIKNLMELKSMTKKKGKAQTSEEVPNE